MHCPSVFEVAADGTAHFGQLATYLVMASGEQFNGQKEVAVALPHQAVAQTGFFAARHFVVVGIRLVLLLVARQPVVQLAGFLRRAVGHDGEVGLVHPSLAEQVVHARQPLAGTGKHHDAAHGAVEPVGNAEKDGAGLGITLLDVGLDALGERLVAGLVALHNLAGGLADDDDVVVLVEYLHGVAIKKPLSRGEGLDGFKGITCSCRRQPG